jgi:glycosyltransferase involved in cell wall biosynthesis
MDPRFSIVIPIHNEEDSLGPLLNELHNVFKALTSDYEIIMVNDCSTDRSTEILKNWEASQKVRVIHLSKRSGQTNALRKGIEQSQGEFIITMDGDLQNDPHDIARMIEKMYEGYDCVCGWRKSRQDTWLKARLSKLANVLQRCLTGLSIHDISCTLRIYKKACAAKIPLNWEGQHRFIPLSLSLQGYKIGEIVSNHRERKFGKTKYSHKRILKVVVDFFKILKTRGRS